MLNVALMAVTAAHQQLTKKNAQIALVLAKRLVQQESFLHLLEMAFAMMRLTMMNVAMMGEIVV